MTGDRRSQETGARGPVRDAEFGDPDFRDDAFGGGPEGWPEPYEVPVPGGFVAALAGVGLLAFYGLITLVAQAAAWVAG